jgi:hypothetical protein
MLGAAVNANEEELQKLKKAVKWLVEKQIQERKEDGETPASYDEYDNIRLFCGRCQQEMDVEILPSGPHQGAHCAECHTWIKWLPRKIVKRKTSLRTD